MSVIDVKIPDIGDFKEVPVIEVQVKPGDVVKTDDALLTLESDKASMEVPAPASGKVVDVLVKIGDKVSEGTRVLVLEIAEEGRPTPASGLPGPPPAQSMSSQRPHEDAHAAEQASASASMPPPTDFGGVYASPSVRRLARELEIDLNQIRGSGAKGRITKDDVRRALAGAPSPGGGLGIPEIPEQDYAKFGPVEVTPLSRLRKLSGPHLHRAWLNVPHVTHTDEADITDLESYRKTLDGAAKEKGYRVTMLAFLMKASVVVLKEFPEVNASLSGDKQSLVLKKYYNIGVAVDTPGGLVVPSIKDVDRKGILELSQELTNVSARMREGKIAPADIQGASFSISSLGGIGGTSFTPIVSAPEVAILGAVKARMQPVWDGAAFLPRLMLPLCFSYDHRVIDGAMAARFVRRLADILGDVRQLVL